MTRYLKLTRRGYMFSKFSGLFLQPLGLLDKKIKDWEFYSNHRKRMWIVIGINGFIIGVLAKTFSYWLIIPLFLITFSLIPKGTKELEDFINNYD